jgi:hypothetical protein
MKTRPSAFGAYILKLLALLSVFSTAASTGWAKGTPQAPTCSRSLWLAMASPGNVVVRTEPNSGNATFDVPIALLPFVQWSKDGSCAQPESAGLKITLTIAPLGGGGAFTFTQNFQLPKPLNPGQQPLPGRLSFPVPAGSLPAGSIPAECTVEGVLSVVFGPPSSTGAGTLSSTGGTMVCLVEPAPNASGAARLDVRYLPLDKKGTEIFPTCRRGDQAIFYFLINNNDANNSATLDLESEGKQIARLPDGFAPNDPQLAYSSLVHSISNPLPGTETFAAAFTDELAPGALIPEPDPDTSGPIALARTGVVVAPLGSIIVPVSMRSYAASADGSCSQRFLKVTGKFADMTPALGCASSGLVVGNVGSKSPLLEISDTIKSSSRVSASWTPAELFDEQSPIEGASIHGAGNLSIGQLSDPRRTETAGANVPLSQTGNVRFPISVTDSLRLDRKFASLNCRVDALAPDPANAGALALLCDGFHTAFAGALSGPLPSNVRVRLPLIVPNPIRHMLFDIFYDVSTDSLQLTEPNPPIGVNPISYSGTLAELIKRPPANLRVDLGTTRTFTLRSQLGLPVITTTPIGLSQTMSQPGNAAAIEVTTTPEILGAKWRTGLFPAAASSLSCGNHGLLGTPIQLAFNPEKAAENDTENISVLNISVAGAANSPARVPVDLRAVYDICLQDDSNGNSLALNSGTGDYVLCQNGRVFKVLGKPWRFTGTIKLIGSVIHLDDVLMTTGDLGFPTGFYLVSADFDFLNKTGTVSVKLSAGSVSGSQIFPVNDTNTADSDCCH